MRGRRAPTQSLVDYAADRVRESVLTGKLAPGEWIRLDAIAQDLGMSPIPLREALRTLASEGLIVPLPRRGYVVAPVTVADLEETYRLRLLLEPLAVRLAVPALVAADIAELDRELDAMSDAFGGGDWIAYYDHHRAFHFGIYERCNSPWLLRFTEMLWLNAQRYQRVTMAIKGQLEQRNKEHRSILGACRKHDPSAAAELMEVHLTRARDSLRAYLAENSHLMPPGPEPGDPGRLEASAGG